ncbi:Folliculin [Dactylella cylindrospora]|nr:Folliculin [Dactylella cylindrospora]
MDFIFSLAHFCEIHGPTSILCTQLLPPSCQTCTTSIAPYVGYSSDDSPPASAPATAPPSRASSVKAASRSNISYLSARSTASARSSISPATSPAPTPPISPKPAHASLASSPAQSLLSTASSGLTDTCANCNLSLPKNLAERLPLKDGKKVPVLRSKEVVLAGGSVEERRRQQMEAEAQQQAQQRSQYRHARRQSYYQPRRPATADHEEPFIQHQTRRRSLSSASSSNSSSRSNLRDDLDFPSTASDESQEAYDRFDAYIPPHTHNLTYLSSRFPSAPDQFAALRRACVRTLSCEALPGQTGPIFVGDEAAGHTIAYVFRLVDPKIRSNRRTYALLCLCPDVKKIVAAYSYITSVFEQLVTRIKNLASEASRPVSPNPNELVRQELANSTFIKHSTCPDGFLRRPARVERGKDLAELVGREQLFVEVHACFATLLGALARRFGCLDASTPVVTSGNVYTGIPGSVASGRLALDERDSEKSKRDRTDVRRGVMI